MLPNIKKLHKKELIVIFTENSLKITSIQEKKAECENKLNYMKLMYPNSYEVNKHKIAVIKERYAKLHILYEELIKINANCLKELRR